MAVDQIADAVLRAFFDLDDAELPALGHAGEKLVAIARDQGTDAMLEALQYLLRRIPPLELHRLGTDLLAVAKVLLEGGLVREAAALNDVVRNAIPEAMVRSGRTGQVAARAVAAGRRFESFAAQPHDGTAATIPPPPRIELKTRRLEDIWRDLDEAKRRRLAELAEALSARVRRDP